MMSSVRTDLALEANELLKQQSTQEQKSNQWSPPGVLVEEESSPNIKITKVKIVSKEGEEAIGKPQGNYITIEAPALRDNSQQVMEEASKELARQLESMLDDNMGRSALIVGLGNWNVTADALGPKTVSDLLITRHLLDYIPAEVRDGVRPVCAVAPGVLGITGIETYEIVKGIVERIKPGVVIAVDSLASRKIDRVSTTIQLSDTGISPGTGVGNKRMEISQATLGVRVIAIGVPTVVDAATLANDAIDLVYESYMKSQNHPEKMNAIRELFDGGDKRSLIEEVLMPYGNNLVVTPKEIDEIIEKVSKVIANGINMALHHSVSAEDINRYLN